MARPKKVVEHNAVKFTVSDRQKKWEKEEVTIEEGQDLVVILPKQTPLKAKRLIHWFMLQMYKWW